MNSKYLVYIGVALCVACGETSGDPKGSIAEGGTAGTSGGSGNGGTSGSASGGSSASGGNAQGGTANGGTSGGGTSNAGAGGSGGAPTSPECVSEADCKLHSDCCDCIGVPKDEDVAGCDLACDVDQCAREGISEPRCVAGRCVTGYECDGRKVICAAPSPVCDPGLVPAISGGCWSGDCVPPIECLGVTQCTDCVGPSVACAAYATQLGQEFHCVEIPEECNGAATCECLGPSVCVQGFNACQDFSGINGVSCSCPAC